LLSDESLLIVTLLLPQSFSRRQLLLQLSLAGTRCRFSITISIIIIIITIIIIISQTNASTRNNHVTRAR
jgi:hypothetical protein